jgi:hypothetical protein
MNFRILTEFLEFLNQKRISENLKLCEQLWATFWPEALQRGHDPQPKPVHAARATTRGRACTWAVTAHGSPGATRPLAPSLAMRCRTGSGSSTGVARGRHWQVSQRRDSPERCLHGDAAGVEGLAGV